MYLWYEHECFHYTRKYYPSNNQFRDPPTYTHQPSMQQKVPFSLIRCSSSKVAFCSCVEWGWHIYNIVESESDPLTRRAVDLFEKEPLKGNSEVHLHTPTKFGEDRSKDLGGDREQTDRQTDKRCSIYSMMLNDNTSLSLLQALQDELADYEPKVARLQQCQDQQRILGHNTVNEDLPRLLDQYQQTIQQVTDDFCRVDFAEEFWPWITNQWD